MTDPAPAPTHALAAEAQALSCYLVGRPAAAHLATRYAAALAAALGVGSPMHDPVGRFALSHRWSLPLLDAAAGVLAPHADLRRRLMVMAAVLETAPEHAYEFMPRSETRAGWIAVVVGHGLLAAGKFLLGAPLLLALGGRRP
jgi:hypothetical protein